VLRYAAGGRDRYCRAKEEKRYAKIKAGIRDQLPMSSCAAVTQDIRLPDAWKRFVPESPGRLRHGCTAEATVEIPDLWRNLRRVKEIRIR
jgi:hypothetical protein